MSCHHVRLSNKRCVVDQMTVFEIRNVFELIANSFGTLIVQPSQHLNAKLFGCVYAQVQTVIVRLVVRVSRREPFVERLVTCHVPVVVVVDGDFRRVFERSLYVRIAFHYFAIRVFSIVCSGT